MEIEIKTSSGLIILAALVNPCKGIAYCQDRLVKVKKIPYSQKYEEVKSIDVIPFLSRVGLWD